MWVKLFLIFVGIFQVKLENFDVLTENFFEDLKANPTLEAEETLSESAKNFIDRQIHNYLNLRLDSPTSAKKKRSLLEKYTKNERGSYLLSRLVPSAIVPVRYPTDTVFFQRNSKYFVASLESSSAKENADSLVIFDYERLEETFSEVARIPVRNATRLAVMDVGSFSLLAVAENAAPESNFHGKSGVFQFDSSGLVKVQSLDMFHATDIVMWRIHDEIYMSIAHFMSNKSGNVRYEMEIPIYKWLGRHFDLVQSVGGKGARKVTPFGNFLAVANFRDDSGNSEIYSEIYKFDYTDEKYELHQRILTKACTDIEIFTLGHRDGDAFLAVANSYEVDLNNEKDHETESIVYKLVDNYFIPFQSFPSVEHWLPVQGSNFEFVLFAISRFNGLTPFQYDGWMFREVPQKMPAILQGSEIKSLRFVMFDKPAIVVSNENNDGKSANMFELEFAFQNSLNEAYAEMLSWCDRSLEKVENLLGGSLFEIVLGEPQRADIDEDEFEEVSPKIESLNSVLDELRIEELSANEIVFNNVTFVHDLKATSINGFAVEDVFDNVLDIETGFELDVVSLSTVKIEKEFTLTTINGCDSSHLIHRSDDLNLDRLTVLGAVTTPEGRLNDASISSKIYHINNLSVKNLTIGGYINDVDISTIDKYALKKNGHQSITATYIFDTLRGKNLEVFGDVSGKKLEDLIDIDSENYIINQDVIFRNDLFIKNLQVSKFLNNIKVKNGRFDILLKNETEEQEISNEKIFDDVVIYNAIYLQGHINSRNFDKVNPVVSVSEDVLLEGDKLIGGQVQIEDWLTVTDIVTQNGTYSLSKLRNEGLRLESNEVGPHLYFTQVLNVDEIFVDSINGRSPRNFVVTGLKEPQIVDAKKTFIQDLEIAGATDAQRINNVDVEDLGNKVLKIEGEQIVEGKHHVKCVIADEVSASVTELDAKLSFSSKEDLIVDNLAADSIKTKSTVIKGLVNELKFDEIVNDTVRRDKDDIITGHKYFENVTVGTLNTEHEITFSEIEELNTLTLTDPLDIKNIKIENLYFEGSFNHVDRDSFGEDYNQTSTFDNHAFDTITVYGNVYIADNKINDIDIGELVENSVKIDESFEFDTVTFEDEIVCNKLSLDGDIENFDLDNLILSEIFGEKIFKDNLTINGNVSIHGLLNTVNLTEFCQLTTGEINKNVTIDGAAFFSKGPNVAKINNVDIQDIEKRAWLGDVDATLTGSVEFEDVIFMNDIEVNGFVDNISISLLYENYFSKSKDQEIPASFYFENGLIFENNIIADAVSGSSNINDVNMDEFVRTALLNDQDQVFENVPFFENCFIQNLTGDFKVNDFDLGKDVVRYDGVNMIVGAKNFENLDIKYLKLGRNVKIQGVDVLDWFKNSVLKTASCNVTGNKTLKNADFVKNLQVGGLLNGLTFDTENLLVKKDFSQNITGIKTIYASSLDPVYFKGIKLKGHLNDIDVTDLINNQVYKNQDNIFKTSINFYNNISVNNLVIKKTYQGVNVSDLLTQVRSLGVLNNLPDQYYRLINMSYSLEESIKSQAFFIHQYKIIQTIPFVQNSQKVLCPDGVTRLGTVVTSEMGTRMELYDFHDDSLDLYATIKFSENPVYISQVLLGRYIYSEQEDGVGHFSEISQNKSFNIVTNQTTSTTSFALPNGRNCTLFTYLNDQPRIFCEIEAEVKFLQKINSPIISQASSMSIGGDVYLLLVTRPIETPESHVDVWKFSNESANFEFDRSLFVTRPTGVASASYRGKHYLAVASGRLANSMYAGRVEIYEIEASSSRFEPLQNLEIAAPVQVEFALPPSQELVLYVVSGSPVEPLAVFSYAGIGGFTLKVKGSSLPEIFYLNQFSGSGSHFIVAQSHQEINVVKAVFKGEHSDDEMFDSVE